MTISRKQTGFFKGSRVFGPDLSAFPLHCVQSP